MPPRGLGERASSGCHRGYVLACGKTIRICLADGADSGIRHDELKVVEWVEDAGEGAKTLRRSGLTQALGMLDAGSADALIVAKLDRLTRSVRDLSDLMDRYFNGDSFGLLSVGEQVDTRTATGRMVLNVITTISQWERERIGERVSDMPKVKAVRRERVGKPPYGFEVGSDGRALVEHPGEQGTIKRITKLRRQGVSYERIAEALDDEGYPARGSRWHPTSVARIVKRCSMVPPPATWERAL